VGVAAVSAIINVSSFPVGPVSKEVPVFNLPPSKGEPARFGFEVEKASVIIDTAVRTGTDYGVVAKVSNTSQLAVVLSASIALWGTPGAPAHRLSRGWSCIEGGFYPESNFPVPIPLCNTAGEEHPKPLLGLPTSCTGPLVTSAEVNSWSDPKDLVYEPKDFGHQMQSLEGCGRLPFGPEFSLAPDTQSASSPAGLTVKVHQNQESAENPVGLAPSDIRSTTVTLPEGFQLNASSANGLEACSESEIGYLPGSSNAEEKIFTPTLALAPLFCPAAAKVGTVKIKVPILANPLEGSVYVARQEENPFGSLVAMYIVAEDPVSGVLLKLPGRVSLNEATGRVTASFENTPQDPFEELEVKFFGGSLAAVATPAHCGSYATDASFTPWSGTSPVAPSSVSESTSGPGGGACPAATLPFSPSLVGGAVNNQAGAFSPFTTTILRTDGSQDIESVSLKLPAGLTGLISSVTPCGETEANAGTCSAGSLIGSSSVSAGVGSSPVTVNGGQVFLTGPYDGAPFGLSIVTPAVAGPFNLGTVIVRARLEIDLHTADVTVTTGAIPHILKGVPVHIRRVNVTISRSGFTINPTNCSKQELTGTVSSVEHATAAVSSPFEAANCASLAFAPKFSASLTGQGSKNGGVGFTTKLTYPAAAQGTQANISRAKVVLPIQLPTRDSTLKLACLAATFETNPAGCPPGSIVGHATATTPLLPVPLKGPVYLISHGGEAFPALTVVLQGDNVTYELIGTTLIRKGITSTSFKTVADVPVSSFELVLPAGKYSALTANLPGGKYDFCGLKLSMPTAFVGQNGAETHQSTPIALTGCPKAKTKKAKAAKKHTTHK
jgi:hypothetical protein